MRVALVALVAAAAALAGAARSPARPSTFGLAETKTCLTHHGALFQAADPLQPEGAKATIPDGSGPDFLYLAVGRGQADAIAVRAKLVKGSLPAPSTSNSVSAAADNAAWTLVTLVGGRPSAKVQALVRSCLTVGSLPGPPASYDVKTFSTCVQAAGSALPMTGTKAANLMRLTNGWVVPKSVLAHLVLLWTASDPDLTDGPAILLTFGSSSSDALRWRASLETALHAGAHWWWTGSRKNVAWVAYRTRKTTSRGERAARTMMKRCLP